MVRRTQQQLNGALHTSDSSTGKNWKAAENLKWNQRSTHWIAGDSRGCFSHLQQSELFLCWLCDMPNTETKLLVRGIPVLLLPYCAEQDHIEVQVNQILPALVLLMMCCCLGMPVLGCCSGEFSPSLCSSVSHTAEPTSGPQPAVVQGKEPVDITHIWDLCSSIAKEDGAWKPWHSVGQHSHEGKEYILWRKASRETAKLSSSVLAGLSFVFLRLNHTLRRILEADQMALRIGNTHRQVLSTALIWLFL